MRYTFVSCSILSLSAFSTIIAGCLAEVEPEPEEEVVGEAAEALTEDCPSPSVSRQVCNGDHICNCGTNQNPSYVIVSPPGNCPQNCPWTRQNVNGDACSWASTVVGDPGACGSDCVSTGVVESQSSTSTCCTFTRTRGCSRAPAFAEIVTE